MYDSSQVGKMYDSVSILILMDSLFLQLKRIICLTWPLRGLNPYFNGFSFLTTIAAECKKYTFQMRLNPYFNGFSFLTYQNKILQDILYFNSVPAISGIIYLSTFSFLPFIHIQLSQFYLQRHRYCLCISYNSLHRRNS